MSYVDDDFRRPVRNHILANLLTEVREFPLILGIFGPPGEGKTFQVETICREIGVKERLIGAGELESENAGAPAQLLRSEYVKASEETLQGKPSVLVIHDLDTILGNWGELVQTTVNRQVVFAQMMSFCDSPYEIAGTTTVRIPMIVTGNNPSILYGPVLRPGRMRLLRWTPDLAMRFRIVSSLFPGVDQTSLFNLMSRHSQKPVSFWADVRAAVVERRVDTVIEDLGDEQVRALLDSGQRIRLAEVVSDLNEIEYTADTLAGVAVASHNYLPASI